MKLNSIIRLSICGMLLPGSLLLNAAAKDIQLLNVFYDPNDLNAARL